MTKSLLILGCGGHGRVVADIAQACGYAKIAFLDDDPVAAKRSAPFPVLGALDRMTELASEWRAVVPAVGDNAKRLALFRQGLDAGFETPSLVHPSAVVSAGADIGAAVVIAPGAIVNVGATIGNAAIVNTGARIDHDCVIGAGCHVAPGSTLSGNVVVGERAWLGTGCAVRQGVSIGADVMVGVGAAVVFDLEDRGTYVGIPARPLETRM